MRGRASMRGLGHRARHPVSGFVPESLTKRPESDARGNDCSDLASLRDACSSRAENDQAHTAGSGSPVASSARPSGDVPARLIAAGPSHAPRPHPKSGRPAQPPALGSQIRVPRRPISSNRRPISSNTLYALKSAEDVRRAPLNACLWPSHMPAVAQEAAHLQGFRQDVPQDCPKMSEDVRKRFHPGWRSVVSPAGDDSLNASATSSASSLLGA